MDEQQKENFNMQIRKMLKKFGVRAHQLVHKRFSKDKSICNISLILNIDGKEIEKIQDDIILEE